VKLLLDQNLAPRLVERLQDAFPGTIHVRELGLERAEDRVIWDFAKESGYAILSKDADFHQMSFVFGHPPKVVWVGLGNCTTEEVLQTVLARVEDIAAFEVDDEAAFLRLS
jgi:predicted nuclease of predicted toxin-antitoxin system